MSMSSKHSAQSAQSVPSAQPIQSAQDFQAELGELIRRAESGEIDLLCARDIEASDDEYKYMVEISRIRDS